MEKVWKGVLSQPIFLAIYKSTFVEFDINQFSFSLNKIKKFEVNEEVGFKMTGSIHIEKM